MKILHTLLLSKAFILIFVELSLQFECLPNGKPIPGVRRFRTSDFPDRNNSPESALFRGRSRPPPVRPCSPARPPPPTEPHFCARSRSPPVRPCSPDRLSPSTEPRRRVRSRSPTVTDISPRILGFHPAVLALLRFIPHTNPHRRFEIRRYTFPADKQIELRRGRFARAPIPAEEQSVLTTSTGDVVAIIQANSYLRGIYNQRRERVGINMESGAVFELSPELVQETPLGLQFRLRNNFEVVHLGDS